MDEYMKKLVESKEFEIYKNLDKATLKIMLMYLKFNLIEIYKQDTNEENINQIKYAVIKSCIPSDYNYLEFLMDCNYRINLNIARNVFIDKIGEKKNKCQNCNIVYCIKYLLRNFLCEILKIQNRDKTVINAEKLINIFLNEEDTIVLDNTAKVNFDNIDIISLMFVEIILKNKFIKLKEYNEETKIAKFNALNLVNLENYTYYINKIHKYYSGNYDNEIELNIEEFEKSQTTEEVTDYKYIYKLASYYTFLIESKKIDVIKQLEKYILQRNKDKISNRGKLFNRIYLERVEKLSCNKETKSKIKKLFNYVLNYNYATSTPFIPSNIVMYTEDREMATNISELIGEYMWYFVYLKDSTKYYEYSMNEIISDKNIINKMYVDYNNGKINYKYGIVRIMDFQNVDRKSVV